MNILFLIYVYLLFRSSSYVCINTFALFMDGGEDNGVNYISSWNILF